MGRIDHMATITIEDPDSVTTKKVDGQGRVYVGRDYRGKRVRVVLETIEDD